MIAGLSRCAAILFGIAVVSLSVPAVAAGPTSVREMTCVDENGVSSTFVGEQVRMGATPDSWRSVDGSGTTFIVREVRMDGVLIDSVGDGSDRNKDFVDCSFVIPVGPNAGKTATFTGFFVAH